MKNEPVGPAGWIGAIVLLALLVSITLAIYPGWNAIGAWSSKADAPAWVQAIGSIAAILVTGFATWYSHALEMKRQKIAVKDERKRRLAVIVEISRATAHAANELTKLFSDESQSRYRFTTGQYFDMNIVNNFDEHLSAIPLHELDNPTVARNMLILIGNTRQFRENLQNLIRGIEATPPISSQDYKKAIEVLGLISKACKRDSDAIRAALETLSISEL
ncbi:MAG: hypothetical protein ACK4F4_10635 [Hylemonella sp.]|uniref:hypothetical protein n=1 Tax=Hylemonella sp. TaxID=2066020 RepID=UPI003918F86D